MIERHPVADGELHPFRKRMLTSTAIPAVLGLSPWRTPGQVFAELQGIDFDFKDSVPLRRGRALEAAVAKMLAEARPDLEIWKANEFICDPVKRIGATPDYYARDKDGKRVVIEIKTVTKRRFDALWGDAPPVHYALQIAVAMMLDDAAYGLLVALVFDEFHFELVVFDVPRIIGAEKRIDETAATFWHNFDQGIPPKVDYERDGALIALMYPTEVVGKVVDLRHDNRMPELLDMKERFAAEAKALETAQKAVDNEIKMKIGDAESALVNGWRVTYKTTTRKAHEVKESTFRVLRPKREEAA